VVPYPIQQNKVEKTSVKGVMGLTRKRIVPFHHMPQLQTFIPTNYVPITMYMGTMPIITSHFIHSYGRTSHRIPMPIKAKVLGSARKGKVLPIKG
jgi:hypothetical protein